MKREDSGYILSTGRSFYANNEIIGIDPDLQTYTGYDGILLTSTIWDDPLDDWSPKEKKELALYMIDLWKKFGGIE
jgi:hypothetical protein